MFEGIEAAILGIARDVELLDRSLVRELGTPLGTGAPDSPDTPPRSAERRMR